MFWGQYEIRQNLLAKHEYIQERVILYKAVSYINILAMGTTQNKPIILTIEKEGNPIPQSISLALLVLANEEITQVYIDTSLTGVQLKEQIYSQVSQLLTPKEMML